jgi:hypothetical protein
VGSPLYSKRPLQVRYARIVPYRLKREYYPRHIHIKFTSGPRKFLLQIEWALTTWVGGLLYSKAWVRVAAKRLRPQKIKLRVESERT